MSEKSPRAIQVRDEDLRDGDTVFGVGINREGAHTGEVLYGLVSRHQTEVLVGGAGVFGFVLYLVLQ